MNNLPERATGVIQQFATSRAGIDIFSDQVIEDVQGGFISALQVRIWCKSMEMLIERINKETAKNQLTESEKYAENKFEYAGASVEKADFGKYDYAQSQDPEWELYDSEEKKFAELRKGREAFLRTMQKPQGIITDDGEAKTIFPPFKKSAPGLKISIK